jgi:hypothetical protein
MKNSVCRSGPVILRSIRSWARTDSGSLVKAMSLVSAPLNSVPAAAPNAATTTTHAAITRQGCRLDARANDSGFSFIVVSPLRPAEGGCRTETYSVCLRCTEYRRTP